MLPTKEEIIRRKKVMQSAGISVPNTDESWGPWWEKLWQKAITHPKLYGKPSVWNFGREMIDKITNNTTYQAEPQPIGGTILATDMSTTALIKRTLNNWQHESDPVRDITLLLMPDPSTKVSKAVKAIPKLFTKEGIKKAGTKAVEAVIRETPRATAGYLGGKGVDLTSEAVTGKSWSENAADKMSDVLGFHVDPIFGEVTNLGYVGGYKLLDRGIRRASFNNITPISYHDEGLFPLTKFLEGVELLKDIPKQSISIKPIKKPAWRVRLESKAKNLDDLSKNMLDNREDALRLALGFKPRTELYIPNRDGTYSYNLDHVYSLHKHSLNKDEFNVSPDGIVTTRYTYKPSSFKNLDGSIGYSDNLAGNGGNINYVEKNGMSYISDTWDLLPFKDQWRLPGFKGAKTIHKYLPDLEVLNALGGKPFTLKMTIPTYVDPYSY